MSLLDTPRFQSWQWIAGSGFTPVVALPIQDRGWRYGMALFESFPVVQGEPAFLPEHWRRLREGCQQREFSLDEEAGRALGNFLRAARLDGFARLYVTAGDGEPQAGGEQTRLFLLVEERPQASAPATLAPLRIAVCPEAYAAPFGGLKTANYWHNIDAYQQAQRRGFGETLLFNSHAELVSASMANVFLVHGSTMRTPATACGARAGVLREWVLGRRTVRECSLFVHDVETADEIFLTNSGRGIRPVAAVEGRVLPSTKVAAQLAEEYAALWPPR